MGWQDRDYNRGSSDGGGVPELNALFSAFPLFPVAGIMVKVHVSLIIVMGFMLFSPKGEMDFTARIASVVILFLSILLHEFGHCFAARWVGGRANEIVMGPLGGLAYVQPPHRPWPEFVATAGGPLVNLLICLVTATLLWSGWHVAPRLNPVGDYMPDHVYYNNVAYYLWWTCSINRILLYFNILPMLPMDGGRILFTLLWPRLGQARAWHIAAYVGLFGAVAVFLYCLSEIAGGNTLLAMVLLSNFIFCWQQIASHGAAVSTTSTFDDESEDSAAAPPRKGWFARRRQRRRESDERRLDAILEKISTSGLESLTTQERQVLERASRDRQTVTAVPATPERGIDAFFSEDDNE
jgi:Zn-dependent protease